MKEPWIAIARPGRFIDMNGRAVDFSLGDLETIAREYRPEKREAPLVIGHPATDKPAFGWTKALKIEGGKLLAQLAQLAPEIREAVNNGSYRHVSMSLWPDRTLKHIGLLGAAAPAIDGLGPVSLAGRPDALSGPLEELAFGFAAGPESAEENPMNDDLNRQIGELRAQLAALSRERDELSAAKAELEKELAAQKEAKAKADEAASAAVTELAAERDKAELAIIHSRLDELVKSGKAAPAEKPDLAETAQALWTAGKSLNFASAGQPAPLEKFLKGLESRPVSPIFHNFAAPPDETPAASADISLAGVAAKM